MELPTNFDGHHFHCQSKKRTESITKQVQKTRYRPAGRNEKWPQIPAPNIFQSLNAPEIVRQDRSLPTVAECATHLEFLEVLFVLRQKVLKSNPIDTVYGIEPNYKFVTRRGQDVRLKDETLWDRRQVKWNRFVEYAVLRFFIWCCKGREVLEYKEPGNKSPHLTPHNLPPLDVLMVWHSFLLNPKVYAAACGSMDIYRTPFPWSAIHSAINSNDWTFKQTTEASEKFKSLTGLETSLYDDICTWSEISQAFRDYLTSFTLDSFSDNNAKTLGSPDGSPKMFELFNPKYGQLAIALRNAVLRQCSFVEKMNRHLWIRSPALSGTLKRAIKRYDYFLKLVKRYPDTMFVPTLDIDLIWHTHQCRAIEYVKTTRELAGKFLNHDDTIKDGILGDGFEETRTLYHLRFGREYRVCGCWDCEALLSALEDARSSTGPPEDMEEIAKNVAAAVEYYKKVELARRNGKGLPARS